MTAIEAAEAALRREVDFNARTLDQLATAVAIFGPDQRLQLLQRRLSRAVRSRRRLPRFEARTRVPCSTGCAPRRKLPEQADFRTWRADLLSAYRSLEAREQWWHLPDGQTLRVIANPNPQGGMTWIYENVTERLDLESRYNSLIQRPGRDPRSSLRGRRACSGRTAGSACTIPSFAAIWGLAARAPRQASRTSPRSSRHAGGRATTRPMWTRFTASVAGVDETRADVSGRMDRSRRPRHRLCHRAAPRRPDHGDLRRRHRHGARSSGPSSTGTKRSKPPPASRTPSSTTSPTSCARRSPTSSASPSSSPMPRIGPLNDKQREYIGYIMSSSDGAARHRQRHPRSCHHRRRHHGARPRRGRYRRDGRRRHRGAPGPPQGGAQSASRQHIAADIGSLRRRRQARPPDPRSTCSPTPSLLAARAAGSRVSARRGGDFIEFTVEDEGAGIPRDFIAYRLRPLRQPHPRRRARRRRPRPRRSSRASSACMAAPSRSQSEEGQRLDASPSACPCARLAAAAAE